MLSQFSAILNRSRYQHMQQKLLPSILAFQEIFAAQGRTPTTIDSVVAFLQGNGCVTRNKHRPTGHLGQAIASTVVRGTPFGC